MSPRVPLILSPRSEMDGLDLAQQLDGSAALSYLLKSSESERRVNKPRHQVVKHAWAQGSIGR